MDLKDKVVLITGGGRGIGAALAHAFHDSGAKIAVVARTAAEIEAVAKATKGIAIVADVQHESHCTHIVKETLKQYGRIDILINNAGAAFNKPLTEHTEADYDTIMNTNVKGVFFLTKAVATHQPHIILSISSGAGKTGFPGLSVYCASKFAVRGLMESFSQETHAKVYTVLPGPVDTRMYQELFDARARVKPEQVADAVVALCQEEPPTGYELELYKNL
jgi:NAD(P)-dependent dehydrogenase (short-subunit alcohol dehydrogenase family)